MMMSEFTERTGYEPSFDEYHYIEESYYEFDGNKDEFCKWWKKASRNGEWAKELKLRKSNSEYEQELREKIAEQEKMLKDYREMYEKLWNTMTEYRDKANELENKLQRIQRIINQ